MRSALPILLVIVVVLAIVLWSLPRERVPFVAATSIPLEAEETSAPREVLSDSEPNPVAIEPTAMRAPAQIPAVSSPSTHPVMSGRFVFEDGTFPPPLNFRVIDASVKPGETLRQFSAGLEIAKAENGCLPHAEGRVGAEGAFEISGLCAGKYRMGQSTFPGLAIEGEYAAPASDLKVVLDGYLLKVLVVDERAQPVVDAEVSLSFRVGATYTRRGPLESKTHLRTDKQGAAWMSFADPGAIELEATAGLRHASDPHFGVGGPSGLLTRTLVLDRGVQGASLTVSVVECGSSRTPVDSYCLRFFDAADGRAEFRIDSKNAEAGGTFRNLVPGRYKVRLDARYSDDPVMYRLSKLTLNGGTDFIDQRGDVLFKLVELVDQQGAQLGICVELGGRLSVRISGAAGVDLGGTGSQLELDANDGSKPASLDFRDPDSSGVTISKILLPKTRLLTEQVLAPGTYSLKVKAKGFVAPDQTVIVRAGKITEVDVSLTPERR